jgi:hypothetical protein
MTSVVCLDTVFLVLEVLEYCDATSFASTCAFVPTCENKCTVLPRLATSEREYGLHSRFHGFCDRFGILLAEVAMHLLE